MKCLIALLFLMLMQTVRATECRLNGGTWLDPEKKGFNAYADIKLDSSAGKVLLEGYTLECRHGLPQMPSMPWLSPSEEILTTYKGINVLPKYSYLEGGLRVINTDYPSPLREGILLALQKTESQVSVPGKLYFKVIRAPGKYINISSGDHVAKIYFTVRTYQGSTRIKAYVMFVNVYARNSLNLSPSTCTINDNKPIVVDFGAVDPAVAGGDTAAGTPYRKSVALSYSCPDDGIDSPIDIKLVGTASSFNSSALATTNPNLAAGIHRLSALVRPGGSFRTSIRNSSGSDTVLFTLFRKAGSYPAAGPFTGSATLVMSVP